MEIEKSYFFYNKNKENNNIYNMNPAEFNNFIKRLRQQYKQHTAEQKEQEKVLKVKKKISQN